MKSVLNYLVIAAFAFMAVFSSCKDDEKKTFTVTFVYANGVDVDKTVEVKDGDKVAKPSNPQKEDCIFKFWQKTGETAAYDFTKPVTANMTLTAQWEEEVFFTVTFVYANDVDDDKTVKVKDGELVAKPSNPKNEGYTFKFWQKTGETAAYDFTKPVTANMTLTAMWEIIPNEPLRIDLVAGNPNVSLLSGPNVNVGNFGWYYTNGTDWYGPWKAPGLYNGVQFDNNNNWIIGVCNVGDGFTVQNVDFGKESPVSVTFNTTNCFFDKYYIMGIYYMDGANEVKIVERQIPGNGLGEIDCAYFFDVEADLTQKVTGVKTLIIRFEDGGTGGPCNPRSVTFTY